MVQHVGEGRPGEQYLAGVSSLDRLQEPIDGCLIGDVSGSSSLQAGERNPFTASWAENKHRNVWSSSDDFSNRMNHIFRMPNAAEHDVRLDLGEARDRGLPDSFYPNQRNLLICGHQGHQRT
jgi:hypothetical protein